MPDAEQREKRPMPVQASEGAPGGPDSIADPATQSLAEALRLSFRILTVLMFALIVVFAATCFFTVKQDEVALVLRFGRLPDLDPVKKPGLRFAWPYPIGQVIPFPGPEKQQELRLESFWFQKTEEDLEKELKGKRSSGGGDMNVLGEGGYNIMGDLNLLHSRWTVQYTIRDAAAFYRNVANVNELLRYIVENAAIRSSAHTSVYDALKDRTTEFSDEVQKLAEARLMELADQGIPSGLRFTDVILDDIGPPRQVKAAFNAVTDADNVSREQKNAAQGRRNTILSKAAGNVGIGLATKWNRLEAAQARTEALQAEMDHLSTQAGPAGAEVLRVKLAQKRDQLNAAMEQMQQLQAEVDQMFARAGGEVARIRAEAEAYGTSFEEAAKRDMKRTQKVLGNIPPGEGMLDFYIASMRIEALSRLLAAAEDKIILQRGAADHPGRLYLMLGQDVRQMKKMLKPTQ